jgi:hypothetical protein
MLDYTIIVRALALLVVVVIVLYQNAQQKRINCAVSSIKKSEQDRQLLITFHHALTLRTRTLRFKEHVLGKKIMGLVK